MLCYVIRVTTELDHNWIPQLNISCQSVLLHNTERTEQTIIIYILRMFFHSPADTKVSHINHFRGSTLIQVYFIDFVKELTVKLNIHTERNSSGFLIQIWISNNIPVSPHLTNWQYQICVRDIFSKIWSLEWLWVLLGSGLTVSRNQFAQ